MTLRVGHYPTRFTATVTANSQEAMKDRADSSNTADEIYCTFFIYIHTLVKYAHGVATRKRQGIQIVLVTYSFMSHAMCFPKIVFNL